MFGTALLNLALVAALPPRTAAAALMIWAGISKIALFFAQYVSIRRRVRDRQLARRGVQLEGVQRSE